MASPRSPPRTFDSPWHHLQLLEARKANTQTSLPPLQRSAPHLPPPSKRPSIQHCGGCSCCPKTPRLSPWHQQHAERATSCPAGILVQCVCSAQEVIKPLPLQGCYSEGNILNATLAVTPLVLHRARINAACFSIQTALFQAFTLALRAHKSHPPAFMSHSILFTNNTFLPLSSILLLKHLPYTLPACTKWHTRVT